MERLLAQTSGKSTSAIRNKALIILLWKSGVRISEALNLRPADIDFDRQELFVRKAKTVGRKRKKSRRPKFGERMIEPMKEWLAARAGLPLETDTPLFCTLRGRPLYATQVRTTLNRLAVKAGWTKRIHPHGLRHTYAVNLLQDGARTHTVQRMLGHESLHTTSKYLEGMTNADIDEDLKKMRW
jgi:site-specific recombinase XerD